MSLAVDALGLKSSLLACLLLLNACATSRYPKVWFEPIRDPHPPAWEILPQEAKSGEVILSKRNELGILSNFAPTPFIYHGKQYASLEGFWQMMLYPENGKSDLPFTREQVAQMSAFEAKHAGDLAYAKMKKDVRDWVTFEGRKMKYWSLTKGEHYRLIREAMEEKLKQNPEVRRVLLSTGTLVLKPDHHQEENSPPEWRYFEVWMELRAGLQVIGI